MGNNVMHYYADYRIISLTDSSSKIGEQPEI